MKASSKLRRILTTAGTTFGIAVMAVTPSFAVSTGTTNGTGTNCVAITTLGSTSAAAINAKLATMNSDFQTRLTTITSREATVDQNVAAARLKLTTTFTTKVTALSAKTGLTAAQKTAITTYSTDVQSAEKTRETAVDLARTTYRTALLATVTAHQTALATAATTFQASVATAFTTAEAGDCGADAKTTLKTSVKTARDTFATARSDAKATTSIKQLIATRDGAIKAADATFASTVKDATAALSTALNTASSPSTSN